MNPRCPKCGSIWVADNEDHPQSVCLTCGTYLKKTIWGYMEAEQE